ncbi:MAG TPA: hypothetical protein VJX29_02415 [Candidatus Acidoferrales bacterium]|nr:hypothetical protein [Candidatus Acidoferrales bacterium]
MQLLNWFLRLATREGSPGVARPLVERRRAGFILAHAPAVRVDAPQIAAACVFSLLAFRRQSLNFFGGLLRLVRLTGCGRGKSTSRQPQHD